jgi:hypothetical protein
LREQPTRASVEAQFTKGAPLSRNDYFYVLHRNVDGRETTARQFENKEFALAALANEVGETLEFVSHSVRSSSHTLKRFTNTAGLPGQLLESFLVTTEDWVAVEPRRQWVATERRRKKL